MSFDFQILDDYQFAWDINNEYVIRSCEQKLIKLDKKTLVGYLQQFVVIQSRSWRFHLFIKQTENKYALCVLHLIHVFCIPGQEEKIKVVQVKLNEVMHTMTEEERFAIFERYLSQRLKVKSSLTEIDLLTDQIDPHNEFLLKLCYWDIFCAKRNNECCKEFLQQNVDYLVSNIERSFQVENLEGKKIKNISYTMLLCLLNWNICKTQNPVILQNDTEPPASSSFALVADKSVSYSCTAHKVSNILQIVWSTLSKDDISTVFNNYIIKMSAMKTYFTEDDFCTDKIEPYFEFILKLCYWDYLCIKKDYKRCKAILIRNADLFVSQIEEVVHGNKTKTKHISCKVLLCLLNWSICDLKSTLTQSKIKNDAIQEQSEVEDTTKKSCTVYKVRCVLENLLSTLTEEGISDVFWNFINQMHTMKSEITPDGLCIGAAVLHHEYKLKLFYWRTICSKNDYEAFKKFIQLYPEVLISRIQKRIILCQGTKTKHFYCRILLCILKIAPLLVQKAEIQNSSSTARVADSPPKYSFTAETVLSILQTLLSTFSEEELITLFNNYINMLYAMKLEITEDDLCSGKIDPYYEFLLKLCHYEKLCNKNTETSFEFLKKNADMFVSQIEILVGENKIKWKTMSCTMLLCILKLNMHTLKTTTPMVQNTEIQACSLDASVADTSTNYSYTANTIWSLLKTLLSTLSEEDMFTTFNNYLRQLYVINPEITEDDLCTGRIEPYHEFMLKLCYCEKLCIKKDGKKMKKFLSRNADFLVSQIEEGVNGGKTQLISCKVLLCLSKWGISNKNTAYISHENILIQTLTFNADYQDFISENALVFLSIVDTVMTQNNIPLLINLCDVFLCIPYKELHFHDITGAVNKLIRYYAKQVGINKKILEWIIKLGYRVLRHLNDNQNLDTAIKKETEFQNLFNLFDDLSTLSKFINFHTKEEGEDFASHFHTKEEDEDFASHFHTKKEGEDFASFFHRKEEDEDFASLFHTKEEGEDFASLFHTKEEGDVFASHFHTPEEDEVFALYFHRKEKYKDLDSHYHKKEQYEDFATYYHAMELFETQLRELWIAKIKCKVKATQISNKIRNKGRENLMQMEFLQTNTTISEQDFIYEWKADLKENQLNIKTMETHLKEIKMVDKKVDEIRKTLKLYEMLVLFMMTLIVMVGVSNGHHKSAKMKKYLSLKYEYATASLYLLWCSGDIEVHPGPSLNKKTLAHASTIERRWIQNISPKIINRLPKHEQSKYKPTKKTRIDRENKKHFQTLLEICREEKVHVPKMYLAEINAWETKEYKLLHKLFVYRCEIETIIASMKDFLTCGGRSNDLTTCNVSYASELKTNEIPVILGNDQRPKDKSQLIVYITRHIAGILIKGAHTDTEYHDAKCDAKCDGLWDLALDNWQKDIILFDPNNRGKYSKKYPEQKLISDQELVDNLITLPQLIIPPKYKPIMDAFRTMRTSQKDKPINKQHKVELCSTFKRITSLEKLDYALKNLWESGIFTEEVHNNLNKWWTTRAVDTPDHQNVSQVDIIEVQKRRRPHILINISTKSITLTVEQTDANSSQVSYDFPFKDELVPLKTMDTTVSQTTIQNPSSDSYQKVAAKNNLTVSPKPDACPADSETNTIIIPQYQTQFLIPLEAKGMESDSELQCKMSSQEITLYSSSHLDQPNFSTNTFSQSNKSIAISRQQGPISCMPKKSTTNSDDLKHWHISDTKDSNNLDFKKQVSSTSYMGLSVSISSVNSEAGNKGEDQNNTLKVLSTDSDYSLGSSNNCVSKTNMKRKSIVEDIDGDQLRDSKKSLLSTQMKEKKKTVLRPVNKQTETDQNQIVPLVDNSTMVNSNMNWLPDYQSIDFDSLNLPYVSADEILTWT